MSKLRNAIRWYNDMAMLSQDEQLRAGHPEINAEHLFLALLSTGGPVTDALASRGVTLGRAREEFVQLHARRLEALGIQLTQIAEEQRRIPDTVSTASAYGPGVETMLLQASKKPQPDVALFDSLLREASGHISEALHGLGITPDSLTFEPPPRTGDARAPGEQPDCGGELIVVEHRHVIPAPPEDVWALIGDPDRFLEWNDLEYEHAETTDAGVVRARRRQRELNGKPAKVRPKFAIVDHVMSRYEQPRLIQWERSLPHSPDGHAHSLRVGLHPEGQGTKVTLAIIAPRPSRSRMGPLLRTLRPLSRVQTRGYLRAKAYNISRALRQA
ncbi:MAG: SRPBCC family protein [Actinomycetaceae bacterium]|nr:SRPBCC family protein [Actinomycetaceae bacterium]